MPHCRFRGKLCVLRSLRACVLRNTAANTEQPASSCQSSITLVGWHLGTYSVVRNQGKRLFFGSDIIDWRDGLGSFGG